MTMWLHTRRLDVPACGLSDWFSSGATRAGLTGRCEGERHNVPSPPVGPRRGGGNARVAQHSHVAAGALSS